MKEDIRRFSPTGHTSKAPSSTKSHVCCHTRAHSPSSVLVWVYKAALIGLRCHVGFSFEVFSYTRSKGQIQVEFSGSYLVRFYKRLTCCQFWFHS